MAKLNAPLMSLSARGTIAKNLTYSERKSGSQVRWQRKQKDVVTSLRTAQRDKFQTALDSWHYTDVGIIQPGYYLMGGKTISISSLPLNTRAPKFSCYVRDVLNNYFL